MTHKSPFFDIMKFAVISKSNDLFDPFSLFNSLFSLKKPKSLTIKSNNYIEFTLLNLPGLSIELRKITKMQTLIKAFNSFNSILIMVDLRTDNMIKELEKVVDTVSDSSEYNMKKKVYLLGIYEGMNGDKQKGDIIQMMEEKGSDYEYIELDIRNIEEFGKVMDYIIKDAIDIEQEKLKEKKHSDIVIKFDKSKSRCSVF